MHWVVESKQYQIVIIIKIGNREVEIEYLTIKQIKLVQIVTDNMRVEDESIERVFIGDNKVETTRDKLAEIVAWQEVLVVYNIY